MVDANKQVAKGVTMSGKTVFEISINNSGQIEVTEQGSGKKGGGLRAKSGHKVEWKAAGSVSTFSLYFVQFEDPFDALLDNLKSGGVDEWPFGRSKVKGAGAKIDELDGKVEDATYFKGQLSKVDKVTVYKYSVKAVANSGPNPPDLDPPIIIEP
jgi:fibronectin type 3 domain-containing protein